LTLTLRNAVLAAVTLAYPAAVYWGLGRFEPRWIAFALIAVAAVRVGSARAGVGRGAAVVTLVLAACTLLGNAALPLKLYPVLVNGVMGVLFAWSLARPPTVIERIARLRRPQLNEHGIAYTRKVTQIWLAFFIGNGAVAAGTALWGSDAAWALYNGLFAYGLMGLLFGGEWLVRQRVMARHG
jgi:uncharacterized membrane protein